MHHFARLLLPVPLIAAAVLAAPAAAEPVTMTFTCPDGTTRAASFDQAPTDAEAQARGEQLCGTASGGEGGQLPADAAPGVAPEGSTVGRCPKAVSFASATALTYFDGTPVGKTLMVDSLADVPAGAGFSITHNGVTWASTTSGAWQFDSSCVKPGGGARTFAPYVRGTAAIKVTAPASAAGAAVSSSDEALFYAAAKKKVAFMLSRKGVGATTTLKVSKGSAAVTVKPVAKGKKAVTVKAGKSARVSKTGVR